MSNKTYLILENGAVFAGYAIGAPMNKAVCGELVFTTGVVGYIEALTDPRSVGQLVVQTFPVIGNYGAMAADAESAFSPAAYVVRELCETPSNFRAEGTLDAFLKQRGIPGIAGVDTRELTRQIRENGTMRAMLTASLPTDPVVPTDDTTAPTVASVSTKERYSVLPDGEIRARVTVLDCGVTKSLLGALTMRGCAVTVVPHDTAADAIRADNPDGVLLSGGPGNPADCTAEIETVRALLGRVPMLGIGLGHQFVALAAGGTTARLPHSHRGANQPVRATDGSRTYMTSQNHGYAVTAWAADAQLCYTNANDGSCEGLSYPARACTTVQFVPDAETAIHTTGFVLDDWMNEITKRGGAHHAER